jgi:hypothetical protein
MNKGLAIITVVLVLLASGYASFRILRRQGGRGATAPQTLQPGASTTVINGTVYLYSEAKGLDKGIIFGGVFFKKFNVLTTGCRAAYYLAVFPDGAAEKLGIGYGCPTFISKTTTTHRHVEAWSKHSSPRAGIILDDGHLVILVSRNYTGGWRILAANTSGDWVVLVLGYPTSAKHLLYEAIYIGPGFPALPRPFPPTPCGILVTPPRGNKTMILDRGLCPWIRNKTWIPPGYTYRYWIKLDNVMHAKGRYKIDIHVACGIPRETYGGNTPSNERFEASLSFNITLN